MNQSFIFIYPLFPQISSDAYSLPWLRYISWTTGRTGPGVLSPVNLPHLELMNIFNKTVVVLVYCMCEGLVKKTWIQWVSAWLTFYQSDIYRCLAVEQQIILIICWYKLKISWLRMAITDMSFSDRMHCNVLWNCSKIQCEWTKIDLDSWK